MGANDTQVDGSHYKDLQASCPECGAKIDHWDWAADQPYLEARCTAYIARHQHKRGLVDIEKALHFIQKIVEKRYKVRLVWRIENVEGCVEEAPYPDLAPGKPFVDRSSQNPYSNIHQDRW